jgi:hypothetical protein
MNSVSVALSHVNEICAASPPAARAAPSESWLQSGGARLIFTEASGMLGA